MKQTRLLMGMPISVEIVDAQATDQDIDSVYNYFEHIDKVFSTYKPQSEISRINAGEILHAAYSDEVKEVFNLSEQTKRDTNGYFDIQRNGKYDPSGLVKGWAINNAAKQLAQKGFKNFYVDAGGDIQVNGANAQGKKWAIGIRNPFDQQQIVKVVYLSGKGIATSGNYIRGEHIYDPHEQQPLQSEISSLSVIGPNVYDADRFATAAYAMGKKGIAFIEQLPDLEGYMIDNQGIATFTSGFSKYTNA